MRRTLIAFSSVLASLLAQPIQAATSVSVAGWNLAFLITSQKYQGFDANCVQNGEFWEWPPCSAYNKSQAGDGSPMKPIASQADWAAHVAALRAMAHVTANDPATPYDDRFTPDVVGVVEVEGAAALKEIFPNDYQFCTSSRTAVQNVGFAVRTSVLGGASPQREEIKELGLGTAANPQGSVRYGVALTLSIDGAPVKFLVVHLKARCVTQKLNAAVSDCRTFARQVPILEKWLDDQASDGVPVIMVGDYNRDVAREKQMGLPARTTGSGLGLPANLNKQLNFWPEIADGQPSALTLLAVTGSTSSRCFKGLDHMVINKPLRDRLTAVPSVIRLGYPNALYGATKPLVSDHCRYVTTLTFN